MYDIIIIGMGPAGVSAAIYLARANKTTLVLGNGIGALEHAEKIENFYGFPGGISGRGLQEQGLRQAKDLGCEVREEEVLSVVWEGEFRVKTNQSEYQGRQLLIAAGKTRKRDRIPGLEDRMGRGVSMCAVCDGFFYRGKRLAVLGSANYAVSETEELLRFTPEITVCTNGKEPAWENELPEGVQVDTRAIEAVTGDGRVEGIRFQDGSLLPVDGIFVAEGTASALDFAVKMGILTEGGNILVDEDFQTNVEGAYAAGDCIGGLLQVSKAVADGALAARAMIRKAAKK